MIMLRNKDPP